MLAVMAVVLLGLFVWTLTKPAVPTTSVAHEEPPQIVLQETFHDFGTISMAEGNVTHRFTVTNEGESSLELRDGITSCMCTAAKVVQDTKISPEFGMAGHGTNPRGWKTEIVPGETAYIETTFDPAAHGPRGTGLVSRFVTFQTNDPDMPELRLRFSANVTP